MSEGNPPLAQIVDVLPSGMAGVVAFYAPLAIGIMWSASLLVRRRKVAFGELMAMAALWAILLAFYGSMFLAEYRAIHHQTFSDPTH